MGIASTVRPTRRTDSTRPGHTGRDQKAAPPGRPARAAAGASEFLLDIVTDQADEPVAVSWFTACTTTAAIGQARRFVAAYDGRPGRFVPLYARRGDVSHACTAVIADLAVARVAGEPATGQSGVGFCDLTGLRALAALDQADRRRSWPGTGHRGQARARTLCCCSAESRRFWVTVPDRLAD